MKLYQLLHLKCTHLPYPIAIRKAKIVYNFGLSECNWVKGTEQNMEVLKYTKYIFIMMTQSGTEYSGLISTQKFKILFFCFHEYQSSHA